MPLRHKPSVSSCEKRMAHAYRVFMRQFIEPHAPCSSAPTAPADTAPASYLFDGIQILRALCAVFVVVSHENGFLAFKQYFGFAPLPSLHVASLFAVAIFFSISGFIITTSSLDGQGRPSLSWQGFIIRRVVRILPFLCFCTVIYNLLRIVGTGSLDLGSMARTILVSPVGTLKPNVVWSIRHEATFYILFAICILRLRERWWMVALWCAAPLVVAPLIWDWHIIPEQDGLIPYDLFKLWVAGGESGANLDFGMGLVAGRLHLAWHPSRRPRPSIHFTWLIALFLLACAFVHANQWPSGLARTLIWAALSGMLVMVATWISPVRNAGGKILCLLGNSSFSLYLMHNTVMLIILALAMRAHLHLTGQGTAFAFLALCVAISILVCEAIYRMCEKPLIRRVRAILTARGR